jgi:hypothetical protein
MGQRYLRGARGFGVQQTFLAADGIVVQRFDMDIARKGHLGERVWLSFEYGVER